jgi:hypothetical protein
MLGPEGEIQEYMLSGEQSPGSKLVDEAGKPQAQ